MQNSIKTGSRTTKALMLCRWQTSSYKVACLRSLANYFVNVSKRKQSVSRVEITCLFAGPELELVLELEVVVPVGPITA
jgi:hypothetical protein